MFSGTALSVHLFVCAGLSLFIICGPYLSLVVCVLYTYNLTLEWKQKVDQEKREAQQIAEKAAKDSFDLDGFDEDEKPTPTPPEPVKVKVEKDPTSDDATTDLGEHVQKIYDKNEQNYKIAVKNY